MNHTVGRTIVMVVVTALLGLALLVGSMGLYLRGNLREQILSRDVTLIEGIAALHHCEGSGIKELDLLDSALAASELRGVVGLLMVDADGRWMMAAPDDFSLEVIAPDDRKRAQTSGAFARFHESYSWNSLFVDLDPKVKSAALVEMVLPLFDDDGEVVLFAQFWMDGSQIEREFSNLDRDLLIQAGVAWFASAGALMIVFYLAYLGLRRSGRALLQRTEELERMNQNLEMAARSAAIGSISAHLMHGLKSPLAGLGAYLRAHGDGEALEATRRMQQLVHETLRVLRQEGNDGGQPLSLENLWDELREKHTKSGDHSFLHLEAKALPSFLIPRRQSNLLRLVLDNLVTNAIEAAPAIAEITLTGEVINEELRLRVRDHSGGIPDPVKARLFVPGVSSKKTGTGLGLSISRQLMMSLHGDLKLSETDESGSCFVITAPLVALDPIELQKERR